MAQVQDHPSAPGEEARLDVEVTRGGLPDAAGCFGELLILTVCQILGECEADADAALGEVGHRPPALLDLQRAVVQDDTPSEVLAEGGGGQIEQPVVPGPLVPADEQQGRSGGAT